MWICLNLSLLLLMSRAVRRNKRLALHVGPALRLGWESAPGWTVASVLLLVVQGALPLASLYFIKLVVDAVEIGLAAPGPDKSAAFEQAALFIGLTGAAAMVSALFRSLAQLVGEAQTLVVTDHISAILHEKSVAVDLAYYESAQYYDTLHRAQRKGPHRPLRIVNGFTFIAT